MSAPRKVSSPPRLTLIEECALLVVLVVVGAAVFAALGVLA